MKYSVDINGYYGKFGGAFIPELLYSNVEELRSQYRGIITDPSFDKEFRQLLQDYAGRPTPLYYAERLSEHYQTNIYLKREDLCHTGSHKINNTLGQILLARRLGKQRIIAETGAGQHGVATATVCALMGLKCIVFMGAIDMERQAPNVLRMRMLGAEVVPVYSGSQTLKDATNEAIRDWINHPEDTHYIIGSVVGPHPYPDMVAYFQSVIGEEIKEQLKFRKKFETDQPISGKRSSHSTRNICNDLPDYVIACVGGGSNAIGAFYYFLQEEKVQLIGVEAAGEGINSGRTAATLMLGKPGILHACKTFLMQDEDGQVTKPHSISAGLDYPGIGPVHAFLYETGIVQYDSVTDKEALQAGMLLTRLEGIIPALESAHALAFLEKLHFKSNQIVVVNLSGRGDKDMETYIKNLNLYPSSTKASGSIR
jgi:tryptophan synthase beta chain